MLIFSLSSGYLTSLRPAILSRFVRLLNLASSGYLNAHRVPYVVGEGMAREQGRGEGILPKGECLFLGIWGNSLVNLHNAFCRFLGQRKTARRRLFLRRLFGYFGHRISSIFDFKCHSHFV